MKEIRRRKETANENDRLKANNRKKEELWRAGRVGGGGGCLESEMNNMETG